MDKSTNASYHAGETKGQVQEKTNQAMDTISNTAQSAKESTHEAGQQMKAKAQGAANAVKDSVNK